MNNSKHYCTSLKRSYSERCLNSIVIKYLKKDWCKCTKNIWNGKGKSKSFEKVLKL